ncbi:hypothetical protein BC828DRAFT_372335 [Blastocladiella britannica]|nr:hypothetical protein BC828DRAFT_372335 [Blastocladiella britannica]
MAPASRSRRRVDSRSKSAQDNDDASDPAPTPLAGPAKRDPVARAFDQIDGAPPPAHPTAASYNGGGAAGRRARSPADRSPTRNRAVGARSGVSPSPIAVEEEIDIDGISIYRQPLLVGQHFALFCASAARRGAHALFVTYIQVVMGVLAIAMGTVLAAQFEGPHRPYLEGAQGIAQWYGYWIVLGILSSVGLGSGLHTFLLFLGPHIAQVTAAAYTCGHLDFDTRTWDVISCSSLPPGVTAATKVTLFSVARKVQYDAFFWGLGTAFGELPPYFVAAAAAASGKRPSELSELDVLLRKRAVDMSWPEWAKVQVMVVMKRFGFMGILIFASIPNPLFDLAGIICGTVGIPFRTFFGATLIGKAVFKASFQAVFVAILFSQGGQTTLLQILDTWVPALHAPVAKFLAEQTSKYLHKPGDLAAGVGGGAAVVPIGPSGAGAFVAAVWNGFITLMLVFFVLSTIEALAKQHMNDVLPPSPPSLSPPPPISPRTGSHRRSAFTVQGVGASDADSETSSPALISRGRETSAAASARRRK